MEGIAKQLFYFAAIVVLMIIAFRIMKKVEDPPEEGEREEEKGEGSKEKEEGEGEEEDVDEN